MDFEYSYGELEVGTLGQFQQHKQVTCLGAEEYGISSLTFDPQEDLLWAATYEGHVTSLYSSSLERYTSFQAHHSDVRQLLPTVGGVVTITEEELRLTSRTGLPMITIKNNKALSKMNCALYLDDNSLLVGCQMGKIVTVDLTQGRVTRESLTTNGVCLLKPSEHYLCCGDVTGHVFMADPMSLQTVAAFPAHMSGMCDMDVVGNYLVTCGLSQRYGQLCVESQLKVFDLRFLRVMSPCDVTMLQPFLIRSVPVANSTILVASQAGDFQLLDLRGLVTPTSMVVSRLNINSEGVMMCAMDVGPSCHCLGFGDSAGVVHMWTDKEDVVMNPYRQDTLAFPNQDEEVLPYISWDSDDPNSTPLSAVPMSLSSYGRGPLFSHWPVHSSKFFRRMAPIIDPEILENMRSSDFVGYAPKPPHILRNQVPYDLERDMRDHVPESPMMRENNPLSLIPKPFRQVEIKYSKLGIETFDFGHYNESKFAGLEIHIPNAYCNSMLQVLYFLEPLRCAVQKHLCPKEFCLACELGLLFRMLDRSEGQSCQASNFLRAFRTLREAAALGLLLSWENEEQKINLGKLIQSWCRFVLQQLNQEMDPLANQPTPLATPSTPSFKSLAPETPTTPVIKLGMGSFLNDQDTPWTPGPIREGPKLEEETVSIIQRLFGCSVETAMTCRCGWSTVTERVELLFSLCYPHNMVPHQFGGADKDLIQEEVPFSAILQQSICRQQRMNSWCEQCSKYKSMTHQKSLRDLPMVLALNCQVESEQDKEFWHFQQHPGERSTPPSPIPSRWVPLTIRMGFSEAGELRVTQDLEEGDGRKSGTGRGSSVASSGCGRGVVSVSDSNMSVSPLRDISGLSLSECGDPNGDLPGGDTAAGSERRAGSAMEEEGKVSEQNSGVEGDFSQSEEGGKAIPRGGGGGGGELGDVLQDEEYGEVSRVEAGGGGSDGLDMIKEALELQNNGNSGEENVAGVCGSPRSTDENLPVSVEVTLSLSADDVTVEEAMRDESGGVAVGPVATEFEMAESEEGGVATKAEERGVVSVPTATTEVRESESTPRLGDDPRAVEGDTSASGVEDVPSEDAGVPEDPMEEVILEGVESGSSHEYHRRSGVLGSEGTDGSSVREDLEEGEVYELMMVVSHVKESWMETQGNLVAHIKVGSGYHQRKEGKEKTGWYLFNDFHITPVKESEVALFPMEWLTPTILIYTKKGYEKSFNTEVSCQLDPIVLLTETHSPRPAQSPATFTPLAFSELPSAGHLVGIDAEFVTLNQEEAEVKSDGTHTMLRPSQFSVARITVIRGSGAMEGSPFIDDYISTSEQVVDYLTQFSGIKPGDLDATMSSKHLTTLKASYLKLLYLLENGVKFVGHGLNKDFRVINILVPPGQIIDTVKLFHLPNQRYVSLKFLAWFFLNLVIQKESHDSCEDARTALMLYRKYQELEARGLVEEMLQKLYDTGRKCNWKVPEPS